MTVEVEVEAPAWLAAAPDAEARIAEAVRAVAALVQAAEPDASVTVLLTDDAVVQDLNARFRGKDRATNVLSFPSLANPEGHLGDIALAYETCAREAAEQGKSLGAHLSHLTAHGLLHLLGHDHEDEAAGVAMEAIEREAMARLGIADPYAPCPHPQAGEQG